MAAVEEWQREATKELRQRARALSTGALVLPPKNVHELELEEEANRAEIDMLTSRRSRLWSILGGSVSDSERERISWEVESATRALQIAWGVKRRLAVARSLSKRRVVLGLR